MIDRGKDGQRGTLERVVFDRGRNGVREEVGNEERRSSLECEKKRLLLGDVEDFSATLWHGGREGLRGEEDRRQREKANRRRDTPTGLTSARSRTKKQTLPSFTKRKRTKQGRVVGDGHFQKCRQCDPIAAVGDANHKGG